MLFNVNLGKNSMTSVVVYEGGLRTTCSHVRSGNSFETDAPLDNNGKGERFSPTDLLATSLATCMITVMGIKSKTMGFDLDKIEIEVEKIMKQDPRRVGGINLFFKIPEALLGIDDKYKQILKQTGSTCPVWLSLRPEIAINVDWGGWK